MVRVLQFGGTLLPWKYQNTEYEKEIESDEVTTEYVRFPNPTSAGVVVKITKMKRKEPMDIGWK